MSYHRHTYPQSECDDVSPFMDLLLLLSFIVSKPKVHFQTLELNVFLLVTGIFEGISLLVKVGSQVTAGDSVGLLQLFAALKDNKSVTSIDLSDNVITDEGMNFLTRVLAVGMAPNLIHINLRGNPISSKGRELLAALYHLRKQLLVRQIITAILRTLF